MKLSKQLIHLMIVFLGVLYLLSGVAKGIDILSFVDILMSYSPFIPISFAAFISSGEILLGFAFILFVLPRLLGKISFFLILIFTIIYVYGFFVKGIEDCGCLGSLVSIPPMISFLRNGLMLITSWIIWQKYPIEVLTKSIKIRVLIVCLFAFTSLSISSWEIKKSKQVKYILKDKNIKDTILIKLHSKINRDSYLLFIFSPNCNHCQKSIPKIKAYQKTVHAQEIIGIYANYFDTLSINDFRHKYDANFEMVPVSKEGIAILTKSYPLLLYVKNDTIVEEYRERIPIQN